MSRCAYFNCDSVRLPCTTIVFFNLPKDERRQIWIKNSGNKMLENISPTANKLFCEKHFPSKYLRRQFNRTLLTRTAIPYKYCEIEEKEEEAEEAEEEKEEVEKEEENEDEFIPIYTIEKFDSIPNKNSNNAHTQYKLVKLYNKNIIELESENDEEPLEKSPKGIKEQTTEYLEIEEYSLNEDNTVSTSNMVENRNEKKIEKSTEAIFEIPTVNPAKKQKLDSTATASVSTSVTDEENNGISKVEQTLSVQRNYSEDEHFLLSLVGPLQRIKPELRSAAKLNILKYLLELECGLKDAVL